MFTYCILCGIIAVAIIVGNDLYGEWKRDKIAARQAEKLRVDRIRRQGFDHWVVKEQPNPRVEEMNKRYWEWFEAKKGGKNAK